MRATTKAAVIAGVVFCSSAAAMAQTISNTRDGNGNLVRRNAPVNNTPPMANSTANNPARPPPNLAPTADQNFAPTSDEVSRMLRQQNERWWNR
jgi:hypothetical protein